MKKILFFLVVMSGLLLQGCAGPRDPLAKFYQSLQGNPVGHLPTSPSCFVSTYDGVIIYHGLPPRPYTVIGRYDRPNLPLRKLAAVAKYHGANAVLLSEHDITAVQTTGVVFPNGSMATTMPVSRTIGYAYLIQIDPDTSIAKPTVGQ